MNKVAEVITYQINALESDKRRNEEDINDLYNMLKDDSLKCEDLNYLVDYLKILYDKRNKIESLLEDICKLAK